MSLFVRSLIPVYMKEVPSIWKQASVSPAPKFNPPRCTESDLWPISMTPTVSKILESFVGSWILDIVKSRMITSLVHLKDVQLLMYLLTCCIIGTKHLTMVSQFVYCLSNMQRHSTMFITALSYKSWKHKESPTSSFDGWRSSFVNADDVSRSLNIFSEWVSLQGSMPQGSWLGPLIFYSPAALLAMQSAVLATAIPSVSQSVRLSVLLSVTCNVM